MFDIKAPASGRFRAVHDSGPRDPLKIRYVVVHSTEGDTAEGAARWFTNAASGGSANMVVDDDEAFRTVPDDVTPWAAPPKNSDGWHLEFAGFAHWTRQDWLLHRTMLKRGAYKAALRCHLFRIPARWVGPVGLRLGRAGLTTHNAVSRAWRLSDHHDPGPGFPRDVFLGYVRQYLAEIKT